MPKGQRLPPLDGRTFDQWTLLRKNPTRYYKQIYWICRCTCGTEKSVSQLSLLAGTSRSCGCAHRGLGNRSHGGYLRPEYRHWIGMKQRCYDVHNHTYHLYGGRGITVCAKWRHDFQAFFADMGTRPTLRHTIDRINPQGNYTPKNCRWATPQEQANNWASRNRWLVFRGERHTVSEWCRLLRVPKHRVLGRLNRGWPVEDALTKPSWFHTWFPRQSVSTSVPSTG